MHTAIRIQSRNRINAIAAISLMGFVALSFLPTLIAGATAFGGAL